MSQDEKPAGAGAVEAEGAPENMPPTPARAATPQAPEKYVPDAYAVGVRVMRIAPAWLLSTTAGFALLILLLSWMRAGEGVGVVTAHVAHNDARSSKPSPAAGARASSRAHAAGPEAAAPTAVPSATTPEPVDAPAPPAAADEPAIVALAQGTPAAPAESPKTGERAQAATAPLPAEAAGPAAKFTVQVGSFNNHSEANARVSALRAAGFEARAAAVEIPGRGTWHRVQVGRFADRAGASQSLAGVRAKGGAAGAIVVPLQD